MRIIHIILGKANPNRMNGVNYVVHNLATQQKKIGLDVEVWGITQDAASLNHLPIYPLHIFKESWFTFVLPRNLAKAVKVLPSDSMIHFHGVFIPIFFAIARLLRKKGIYWTVSPHGALSSLSFQIKTLAKIFLLLTSDHFLLKNAHILHALTSKEAVEIAKWCKTSIAIISNAYGADENHKLILRQHAPVIFGYIGRLDKNHKGLDILLAGFRAYRVGGGTGQLWLIGGGKDKKFLQRFVRCKRLENCVVFHDACFGKEKYSYLQQFDVFVHTSRWEGMPIAVLEAAYFLKPLILSKATGLAEAVTTWQAGYILPENNVENIALSFILFEKFHKANKLLQMGQRARDMIISDFNWPLQTKQMNQKLYKIKT